MGTRSAKKSTLPLLRKASNLRGKRVILRLDLNVPLKGSKVLDDTRIEKALPSIKFLKKAGARTIIVSHLGSDGSESLAEVGRRLHAKAEVRFVPELIGREAEAAAAAVGEGEAILLENLRKNPGEKENNTFFAIALSRLGELYVNDAFSASHRPHASIISLPKFLPSFAGLQFEEEMKELSKTFEPKHPFLFILGGAKFDTKLPLIKKYLSIADEVFVGGALMNSFFKAAGYEVGKSLAESAGEDLAALLKKKKLIVPSDVAVEDGSTRAFSAVKRHDHIRDIGPQSLARVLELITEAKEVLFNGPLGEYELGFTKTTEAVLLAMAKSKARTVVGGGDTLALVSRLGVEPELSFVSTAGGAMIEFLSTGTLPGIEALLGRR